MKKSPGNNGVTGKTGQYFEQAEFGSDLPVQFLVAVFGITLVIFEGSLGLWSIFYGATPLLSLIFLYWMSLHFEKFVPMIAAFLIGIVSDLLFSDLLGGRAIAYMMVLYVMQYRRPRLLQSEFMEIWTDFAIMVTIVTLFQFIIFSLINLAIPSGTPLLFQLGSTLIIFPIGYVIFAAIAAVLQRMKSS